MMLGLFLTLLTAFPAFAGVDLVQIRNCASRLEGVNLPNIRQVLLKELTRDSYTPEELTAIRALEGLEKLDEHETRSLYANRISALLERLDRFSRRQSVLKWLNENESGLEELVSIEVEKMVPGTRVPFSLTQEETVSILLLLLRGIPWRGPLWNIEHEAPHHWLALASLLKNQRAAGSREPYLADDIADNGRISAALMRKHILTKKWHELGNLEEELQDPDPRPKCCLNACQGCPTGERYVRLDSYRGGPGKRQRRQVESPESLAYYRIKKNIGSLLPP